MESYLERLSRGDEATAKLVSLLGGYSDSVETIVDPAVRDAAGTLPVLAVQRLESGWRVFCEDPFLSDSKWVFSGIRLVARILTIEAFRDAEIVVVSARANARRDEVWRQIAVRNPCIRAVLYSLPTLNSNCEKFPVLADGIATMCGEALRMPVVMTRRSFKDVLESLRRDPVKFTDEHPLWGLTLLCFGILWGEVIRREFGGVWHQPEGDGRPELRLGDMRVRPFEQIAHSFTHGFSVPG